MDKPKMKSDIAIHIEMTLPKARSIYFHATDKATAHISQFGMLDDGPDGTKRLAIDARFDFDEVVAYIENYGKEN